MTSVERALAQEIRRIARDELALEWDVSDDEPLRDRLDSLALLSLLVAIEDRFRIRISEAEGASIRSLADLSRVVAARRPPVERVEVEP